VAGRILKLDTSTHQTVQELLPWLVTNTLSADETAMVREHVRTCTQCQSDVDWQCKLRAAILQDDTTHDVDRAFAQLSPRLEAPQRGSRRSPFSALSSLLKPGAGWMRWAIAIQAAIIAGLAILLVPHDDGLAVYRALGTHPYAAGNVVVTFRPETTEQELRSLLQESAARIVDGPTATGTYVLNVPGAEQARAIEVLRSKPVVVLAEPLSGGGVR
jgi:hypothetical protein